MQMNEANARITEQLTGRTIDHVIRNGKDIELVCMDGHVVVLAVDTQGNIQHKKTDVRIVLPGVTMNGVAGRV